MAENQEITITFTARTTAALALGTLSQNRVQSVGTRTVGGATQTFTATDFAYVTTGNTYGAMAIDKTSSASASTPLYPGDTVTYTTRVTNSGASTTLTGVSLNDPMPAGTSYVTGTGMVTCETGAQNYNDAFGAQQYTNTNGSLSWAANPWTETDGQGGGATGGLVWVTPAAGTPASQLQVQVSVDRRLPRPVR